MKTLLPNAVRDADTLNVEHLNSNFREMQRALRDGNSQRYTHSSFTLRWEDYDQSATTAERRRLIKPPGAGPDFYITGVDLYVYGTADDTFTLTLGGDDGGWEDLSVTGLGLTTLAATETNMEVRCTAGTELTFELDDAAGTWAAPMAWAVIHIRSDRHDTSGAAQESDTFSPPIKSTADTDAPADYDTQFTAMTTDVTALTAATSRLRIEVIHMTRNTTITNANADERQNLPAYGRHLHSWDVVVVGATGISSIVTRLRDEVPSTLGTVDLDPTTGTIVKSQGNSINDTQGNTDPDDTADDYYVEVSGWGAGSAGDLVQIHYAILYWLDA